MAKQGKKYRTAFSTTFFPMEEEYVVDFFESLSKQTTRDFDVVILNDGYGSLECYRDRYQNLNIIELCYSNTPAKNREYAFKFILDQGYDYIVFGDSDDLFESNRVELSLKTLQKVDIAVNDVTLFEGSNVYSELYMSNRLSDASRVSAEFVRDKNIFGLSNTAVRCKAIDDLDFDSDIVALDWYFFSRLLEKGKTAQFLASTVTYYRQYEGNTVGLKNRTSAYYANVLRIKKKHYELMSKVDEIYLSYLKEIESIELKIDNGSILSKHLDTVFELGNEFPLWWECEFIG